jgi:hypothetical protein
MMFKNLFMLALFLCLNFSYADTAAKKTKKRLQIVFMFGQSEMVSQAKVSSAFYMLEPQLMQNDALECKMRLLISPILYYLISNAINEWR